MEKNESLFKILGFANRARKITLGMSSTIQNLKKGKTISLILASDIAANAEDKIKTHVKRKPIPIFYYGTKKELGLFFGRDEVGIIGIMDANFARAIHEILK